MVYEYLNRDYSIIITMAGATTGSFPIYHRLFNFSFTTHSSISLITLNFPHRPTTTTTISSKPFNLIPQSFNPSFSFHEFQEEEEEQDSEPETETLQNSDPKLRLFVGNLPFSLSSFQLAQLFGEAGNVVSVEVFFDPFQFLSLFYSYMRKYSNYSI